MRSGPRSPISFDVRLPRDATGNRRLRGAPPLEAMSRNVLIALISTDYPPLRTSAAVQLRDLAQQFAALGHRPVVIVPALTSHQPWTIERLDGIELLRVAAPPTRTATLLRRALAEMWLPFAMLRHLRHSPFRTAKWDLVVWYSPPIFFA